MQHRRRRACRGIRVVGWGIASTSILGASVAQARGPEPAAAVESASAPAPESTRLWGSAAYFGELFFHPGVALGVDYRILGNHRWAFLLAGTAATYVHIRNNVGLMLYPELGGRLRLGRKRRAGLEAYAGLGYMHTFLHGTVYEIDPAGGVREAANRGRPALMTSGSLGVSVATKWVTPFFRLQVFGQYPFNDHMLMHAAGVLGVRVWIPVAARRVRDDDAIPPPRVRTERR